MRILGCRSGGRMFRTHVCPRGREERGYPGVEVVRRRREGFEERKRVKEFALKRDPRVSGGPPVESLAGGGGHGRSVQGNSSEGVLRYVSSHPIHISGGYLQYGTKGRLLGDTPTAIIYPPSAVRRGRGVVLKKRNNGAVIRAAAAALTRGNTTELSQRHQLLLQEATTAWELGKSLGLRAVGGDTRGN
ncbi:hypothetical protein Dimus_024637 [Dionaea muscipula]